ncbi:hypothetical protein ALC62_08803, partial [Cyphomyrmex costatus]
SAIVSDSPSVKPAVNTDHLLQTVLDVENGRNHLASEFYVISLAWSYDHYYLSVTIVAALLCIREHQDNFASCSLYVGMYKAFQIYRRRELKENGRAWHGITEVYLPGAYDRRNCRATNTSIYLPTYLPTYLPLSLVLQNCRATNTTRVVAAAVAAAALVLSSARCSYAVYHCEASTGSEERAGCRTAQEKIVDANGKYFAD